ncbi:MAG TPA: HD domain-containing phosphohydrolase [Bryobacteraceae bacterium]|jgi:putative two-component system response regulator|nr:HD domain-containing phosphohydrolase [Bryobacteraceae bacterium]
MSTLANAVDRVAPVHPRNTAAGIVMVVDDNPANLRLMEEMLRPRGYEVRSFPRGRMALAAAGQKPPDLILLDITMPEMTGYEVCERLKANPQLSKIPVIFLSALDALEDRLQGFRSGGVDYISKPFQFEEVQARVDAHVRLRRFQIQIETDNRRLQDLVQAQVRRIAEGHLATIFAIARLAETRDDQTGKHLERIQTFCQLLAEGLSRTPALRSIIDKSWIEDIFHASPLHDIGKVAIPDRILQKPGKLTPEETAIMKTHTTLGAHTLRAVHERFPDNNLIAMGIDAAQSHHERWDGGGYPDGLRGEEIPLCARILAVADCYDALRSKRCYKPAISHEETCGIILEGGGTQFDPAVIAVFRELAETFRDVRHTMDIAAIGANNA